MNAKNEPPGNLMPVRKRIRILLTGAAGFIGSHIAQRLVSRGDIVVGVDNFNRDYDPNRKWANIDAIKTANNFTLLPDDICDSQANLFRENRFDAVVHLAAMAGIRNSVRNPALCYKINLTASLQLIELARQHNIKNFVFASTSSIYGRTCRIPFVETDSCGEPLHPYAASKRAAEQVGLKYYRNYGLNFTALRLFTVYGPRSRPDMMPSLVADSILTGRPVPLFQGEFYRDWTFVDDIADGIVLALDRPLGFEIINLGRGQPESLTRLIQLLEKAAGARANLVPTEAPNTELPTTFADYSKAANLLGFQPTVSLEQGIQNFCAWHKKSYLTPLFGGVAREEFGEDRDLG